MLISKVELSNDTTISLLPTDETVNFEWTQKFPSRIIELPATVEDKIVKCMNLKGEKDWKAFAKQIWPKITSQTIEEYEQQGRMEKVMKEWKTEGGTTEVLFKVLNHLQREDVLQLLEKLSR